jgi:protein kinase A
MITVLIRSDAKSLVKHLLVHDITERYGCMKNGVEDIKKHRWFNDFDFNKLLKMELPAPYVPPIADPGDTSNFSEYPDSENEPTPLKPSEDPFIDW